MLFEPGDNAADFLGRQCTLAQILEILCANRSGSTIGGFEHAIPAEISGVYEAFELDIELLVFLFAGIEPVYFHPQITPSCRLVTLETAESLGVE